MLKAGKIQCRYKIQCNYCNMQKREHQSPFYILFRECGFMNDNE